VCVSVTMGGVSEWVVKCVWTEEQESDKINYDSCVSGT
jgi:hypothetical protein